MSLTLVVLAAGLGTRFGALKQLAPLGPGGEALLDYAIADARRAGFGRVVMVIRREIDREMRAHVALRWGGTDVAYAYQETDPGRRKPWGTAEALLAAARRLRGPFGVCNADDFYGAEAFAGLGAHLGAGPEPDHALVGYPVRSTLSVHGGVSRAVCEVDREGFLRALTELREVRDAGGVIAGVDPAGEARTVPEGALVSLNLWGFAPGILRLLRDDFAVFRDARRDDADAEFLISTAVDALVRAGAARVRVLPTTAAWMGITHPRDREAVAERLTHVPTLPRGGT